MKISKSCLLHAAKVNPNGLIQLANFLHLKIEGMKPKQIAKLIYWRITRQYKNDWANMAWRW